MSHKKNGRWPNVIHYPLFSKKPEHIHVWLYERKWLYRNHGSKWEFDPFFIEVMRLACYFRDVEKLEYEAIGRMLDFLDVRNIFGRRWITQWSKRSASSKRHVIHRVESAVKKYRKWAQEGFQDCFPIEIIPSGLFKIPAQVRDIKLPGYTMELSDHDLADMAKFGLL